MTSNILKCTLFPSWQEAVERLNLRNLWLSGPSLARLEAGLETKVLWLPISINQSIYLSINLFIYLSIYL